jgi:hypothetical protein
LLRLRGATAPRREARRFRRRADKRGGKQPKQCRPTEPVDRSHHLRHERTNRLRSTINQPPHLLFDPFPPPCLQQRADSHAARAPRLVKPLVSARSRAGFAMAPQPLHTLRLSTPAGHAVCRCSAAPIFGKRLPAIVAFPRAGSGGAVVLCSAVQESSTSTTGTAFCLIESSTFLF